jgi:hypothetical protein
MSLFAPTRTALSPLDAHTTSRTMTLCVPGLNRQRALDNRSRIDAGGHELEGRQCRVSQSTRELFGRDGRQRWCRWRWRRELGSILRDAGFDVREQLVRCHV